MTVKELLKDAIEYDESFLAHFIFFVIGRGKIKEEDRKEKLMEIQLTEQEKEEFFEMYERDELGMKRILLYAVKVSDRPHSYAFYFAETPEQVVDLHEVIYKWKPKRIHNVHRQWLYREVYDVGTGKVESFKEILGRVVEVPLYLGEVGG
ncbi:hypothetical protein ACIQ4I_13420 [Rummeliibacillus sp. NPDC094406]|uniref:hypothetical protein n=1 Tax=Rummeliibacillus sp. NPDC094406 TaxID=3364511 RepID=UPI0037FA18A7